MQIEEDERLYTVTDVGGGQGGARRQPSARRHGAALFVEIITVRAARAEEIERGVSLP